MKGYVDKIFITNLPAFYKINLFNKIAEKERIIVIFTGNTGELRNADFFKEELIKFEFFNLKNRSVLYNFFFILKLFFDNNFSQLILGGWDESIMYFASIISRKKKNALIVESSVHESKTTGIKGVVKKIFLNRISKAYVPGISNIELLKKLNFEGQIIKTKGVGLFNIMDQPAYEERDKVLNFLYVGRLSKEKNLPLLIETFSYLPHLNLNIVGFGPEENYLKSIASPNVKFHGAVDNLKLYKFYRMYDVFILPSLSETWGLVVEEALNNGMPVIVSNRVGCAEEIIKNNENGLIFSLEEEDGLRKSIKEISNIRFYNKLRKTVSEIDFQKISQDQVNAFLSY
ncbi:hypothetical protein GCM10010992_26940 [Cloacibacterium rupense]|uniref:Glycosyl transferase family 1 domain-containing protein n=1 Tax=Cloacibacterium rupense TaxID=517423 RepID=A0ABQ2NLQ7_9FLAO|nr:glycosyltransferase [Cloacibacterium rupense]GGP06538.1 hypothetical protein GCM10010992_26940 [Cloacibacterium rupense]